MSARTPAARDVTVRKPGCTAGPDHARIRSGTTHRRRRSACPQFFPFLQCVNVERFATAARSSRRVGSNMCCTRDSELSAVRVFDARAADDEAVTALCRWLPPVVLLLLLSLLVSWPFCCSKVTRRFRSSRRYVVYYGIIIILVVVSWFFVGFSAFRARRRIIIPPYRTIRKIQKLAHRYDDDLYGDVMFPGGCCDDPAAVPSSMYTAGTVMPLAVTGFAPAAVDRHRHSYAPHLQQQQHHHQQQHGNPQLSYHQLHDSPMQLHRNHRNLCAAMSPVTSLDNGYRSMSSSSLSPPMSSSSSMSPVSYQPVYSPNQPSYDCHGVPAHPSVADFPPQPHNQYYIPYDNNHPPIGGLNDAQVPVAAMLPNHSLRNNNNNYYHSSNNNNNNYDNNNYNNVKYNNINNINNPYTDRCEYRNVIADKPTTNK